MHFILTTVWLNAKKRGIRLRFPLFELKRQFLLRSSTTKTAALRHTATKAAAKAALAALLALLTALLLSLGLVLFLVIGQA